MTTDTVPSRIVPLEIDGVPVTITGIAKGAGMIAPNMATMLGFVATDAPVAGLLLGELAASLAAASFNRITIDGDASTNDSFVLVATGKAAMAPIVRSDDPPAALARCAGARRRAAGAGDRARRRGDQNHHHRRRRWTRRRRM